MCVPMVKMVNLTYMYSSTVIYMSCIQVIYDNDDPLPTSFHLSYSRLYLLLIGVSCLVRPTGAILWPPLVLAHWIISQRYLWTVVRETILMGSVGIATIIIIS